MSEWEYIGMDDNIANEVSKEAIEWHSARLAFLALPSGSDKIRPYLDRLANAEDSLSKAVAAALIRPKPT